jgi:hypothetical protein
VGPEGLDASTATAPRRIVRLFLFLGGPAGRPLGRQDRRSVRSLLGHAVDDGPSLGAGEGGDVPAQLALAPGAVRKLSLVVERKAFADPLPQEGRKVGVTVLGEWPTVEHPVLLVTSCPSSAYRSKNPQPLGLAFRARVGADNTAIVLARA